MSLIGITPFVNAASDTRSMGLDFDFSRMDAKNPAGAGLLLKLPSIGA
jgi:hypothetical protein